MAETLLNLGCVKLSPQDPFTYASGLKGPIYCDNRLAISDVGAREKICQGLTDSILATAGEWDCVAGVATAGIAHAAWVCDRLKKPMIYIRSQAKGHGHKNAIEGKISPDERVVVIEDLINSGKSTWEAIEHLLACGVVVKGIYCIVDYEFKQAGDRWRELGITHHSLTDFTSLIKKGVEMQAISYEEQLELWKWHKDPKNWRAL